MSKASPLTIKGVAAGLGWPVWKARKWIWKLDVKALEYRIEGVQRKYPVAYYDPSVIKQIKEKHEKA